MGNASRAIYARSAVPALLNERTSPPTDSGRAGTHTSALTARRRAGLSLNQHRYQAPELSSTEARRPALQSNDRGQEILYGDCVPPTSTRSSWDYDNTYYIYQDPQQGLQYGNTPLNSYDYTNHHA